MKKIKLFFKKIKEYIEGDFAYQNYLTHLQKHHPGQQALDKKSFLKNQQKDKWNKINRCC